MLKPKKEHRRLKGQYVLPGFRPGAWVRGVSGEIMVASDNCYVDHGFIVYDVDQSRYDVRLKELIPCH